jgi:hypothetical protein
MCLVLALMYAFAPCSADARQAGTVWTIDFVQTKDGQFENYQKYLNANWRAAREEMRRDGAVVSYAVLVEPAGIGVDWNIILMTEYASEVAYDAREQSYGRAVARIRPGSQGPILIDGKGPRDLADIKSSRVVHTRIRAPH